MKLVEVNGLHTQPSQRLFAAPHDVRGGEVVAERRFLQRLAREADAALRRDEHALAHAADLAQHVSEGLLRAAATVDVRVVEERVTRLERREDGRAADGASEFLRIRDAPAAIGQTAGAERAFTKENAVHNAREKADRN